MAGPVFYNRVKETTTTTGTGTVTLAGAATGYQSFAVVGNANTCYYTIAGGSEWEVGLGTYTAAGTTLARTAVLASSNTNAAVNFSAGSKDVFLDVPAEMMNVADVGAFAPQFRLTTESGVPVSTTDRTAQGTIYLSPCTPSGIATTTGFTRTYTGNRIRAQESGEVSLALTATNGKNYDVFQKNSDLSLVLSSAWTNDTTRADALAIVKNLIVANADNTYTWVGTIRASGANVTEDSGGITGTTQVGGKRFVWNAYQQVARSAKVIDTTATWSYTTDTTRQANGAAGNQVEYVTGNFATLLRAEVQVTVFLQSNSASDAEVGIGIDSTSAFDAQSLLVSGYLALVTNGGNFPLMARYASYPGLGYHKVVWLERGADGTATFAGNTSGQRQSGLIAILDN